MSTTTGQFNPAELLRLLDQLEQQNLLVVGDLMLDTYIYGRTDRVSREAPVPVIVYSGEKHLLGGAGNAARNGADLGAQVSLLAVIGDDEAGRQIRQELDANHIDSQAVLVEEGRHSLNKLRVMAGAEGTARQQVLRLDRGQVRSPNAAVQKACVKQLRDQCKQAQAVVVSDYGGQFFDATMREVLQDCAKTKPVIIDSRYQLEDFHGPFYLKPNAEELHRAVRSAESDTAADSESLRNKIVILQERSQASAILSTHGRQGMILRDQAGHFYAQAIFGPAEVTDVTGAGDSVAASFALALACGAKAQLAMQFASLCAGLVVQKPGAATVTIQELSEAISRLEQA